MGTLTFIKPEQNSRGRHHTNIEKIMFDAIKNDAAINKMINTETELAKEFSPLCRYGYVIDIAIPSLKLMVECDGEHWHKVGNSHDRKRDGYFKRGGWHILRFRGNDILSNTENCLVQIRDSIKRRKEKWEKNIRYR